MNCSPEAVFAVLGDGWLLSSWVVGASRMRDVDTDWPMEGSKVQHSFGLWPAVIDDDTTVLEYDFPRRMVMQPKGWPIGEARVTIDVKPRGRGCVVRLQEEAVDGPGAFLPQPLLDIGLHLRNVETLRRLAFIAEGISAPMTHRGVAVVTGGTAGLGRALVRELAERGWDVAILARGEDGLAGTVADVEAIGRRALGISTDVADAAAVETAASRIEAEFGLIELWVNDAMVGVFGEFLTTDPDDFARATRVNYVGFVNGTRAALSRMVPRDRGHVIQVGSALAHRGIPLQAAYCGAKHAVRGFTDSVTAELMHRHSAVKISEVDMPALNTIQFNWVKSQLPHHPKPVPPIYEPEVGAKAIADVADRPRRRTWVGEPTVATILGERFAGGFLDWYLARTAYSGQQAPEKSQPMLPTNLYEPVPGDQGARGIFSDEARTMTPQIWAIGHRRTTAVAAGALLGGAAAAAIALARRR